MRGFWCAIFCTIIFLPTADARLEPPVRPGPSTALADYKKAARAAFEPLGIRQITILHTRDRKFADSEEFIAPLRNANCVWIP
jgi:cyanophycinase-like exopeptidase